MGATMVKVEGTSKRGCDVDADCWTASTTAPIQSAITTDADKAKSCCMYIGITAIASGSTTEIASGDDLLAKIKAKGLPVVVGEATKYCDNNYTDIYTDAITDGATVDGTSITYSPSDGNVAIKQYCDGGAATLAAVTASIAVATISLY